MPSAGAPKNSRQQAADEVVHRLGLVRGGGEPGADGPHRLISDDQVGAGGWFKRPQALRELVSHHLKGLVRLSLRFGLADAQDGDKTGRDHRGELLIDDGVGVAEVAVAARNGRR